MSRRNVEQQRGIAVRAGPERPRDGEAVRLLRLFEHLPEVHLQDRDRLRAELAYERVKP